MKTVYEKFLRFEGGKSVVMARIVVDNVDELPEPDGIEDKILEAGSRAEVVNSGSLYKLNSEGSWVKWQGDEVFNNAADLKQALASGAAADRASFGDIITVSRTTSDGETRAYDWEIIGKGEDGPGTLTLQLYRVWDELMSMGEEALACFPEGLPAGNYSIGLPSYKRSCLDPDSPGRIYFSTSAPIPAGGQICVHKKKAGAISGLRAYASAEAQSSTFIEIGTEPADGIAYTDLGSADGLSENINHFSRAFCGSSFYPASYIRSWLNSDEPASERDWIAENAFSRKPEITDGFLYGWEPWFKAMIRSVTKRTYHVNAADVAETQSGYTLQATLYETDEKAFLPSVYELGSKVYNISDPDTIPAEGTEYAGYRAFPKIKLNGKGEAVSQLTRTQLWITEGPVRFGTDHRWPSETLLPGIAPIVVIGAAENITASEITYTTAADNAANRSYESSKAEFASRAKISAAINSAYSVRDYAALTYANLKYWYRTGAIDIDVLRAMRNRGVITVEQLSQIVGYNYSEDDPYEGEEV